MSRAVLDDHLLRDLLADDVSPGLARVLRAHQPATTNLYLFRLCRSIVSSPGGSLTGGWTPERRRTLGGQLAALPAGIEVVALRSLAYPMAELTGTYRLSTLGAEAVRAAERLGGPLCVWDGDVGPQIRMACEAVGVSYLAIAH